MRGKKRFGLIIVILGFFIFGIDNSKVLASEVSTTNEIQEHVVDFDLTTNEPQESTYYNENGEEVTITIEPIQSTQQKSNKEGMVSALSTCYFPFGTSSYKVKATTPYMGISYYIDVYVPSNVNYSKITKVYSSDYWIIGGTLNNIKLTRTDKVSTFSADVYWLGGMGGANVYLKGTLSGNVLTTSSRM
ncbi:DUF5626 family protein [Robertmurraya beringensis]|uniref:DUF5626 family protein n=1 Tax=Robertmurraya beringensis TaxID=641660 RepID=A0ABV6KVK7_9BACI